MKIIKSTLLVVVLLATPRGAAAEVTRVDVTTRADVGASGYEKIVGVVHFAVDPKDPHNRVIADIDKAPVNAAGRVEFSADLYILRPRDASRSNNVAFVDVVNRGRKMILSGFNRATSNDPVSEADLGDSFLMKQGYTLVWVGWQFDVRRQGGMMGIDVPAATGVSDIVRAEFTPNERVPEQVVTDLAGYTPADPNGVDSALTVRDSVFGRAERVPRDRWTLQGNKVTLAGGFEPGRTYEISYRAKSMPIAGLGMAAFRDVATWVKRSPDAPARAQYAVAFGSSQSGRFLRTFMYYGFNSDEHGGQVLDGVMAHIAGAARLSLNERGAIPNGLSMWTATAFPFANGATADPVSGRNEGLLDNDRARENQPKVMFTNTAVEYWGGGRSAALVHTTPDGKSDLPLPANARAYFLTGAQHSPSRFPPAISTGQQLDNPVEYVWTLRALLVAMDNWVKHGTQPPASQHPRLADRTLVAASDVRFPAVAGVASPRGIPPAQHDGKALPLLVPQVGDDGNELAGVRTAEIAVPVATYTGWNFRNAKIGGADQLVSLLGSSVPLAKTKAQRDAAHDPRPSLEERYPTHEAYIAKVREASERLRTAGYLLADDVPQVMKRAEIQWEHAGMAVMSTGR